MPSPPSQHRVSLRPPPPFHSGRARRPPPMIRGTVLQFRRHKFLPKSASGLHAEGGRFRPIPEGASHSHHHQFDTISKRSPLSCFDSTARAKSQPHLFAPPLAGNPKKRYFLGEHRLLRRTGVPI